MAVTEYRPATLVELATDPRGLLLRASYKTHDGVVMVPDEKVADTSDLESLERNRREEERGSKITRAKEACKTFVSEMKSNSFVTLVTGFAVTGALCFGIDQGLMSVILVMNQFQNQFPQLADGAPSQSFYKGLVTALLELGAFFGAFLTPHVSDHRGRKWAMRTGCVFFLIGAAIQTGSPVYGLLVVGRFIGGIGIGLLSSTMSVYVAEIAPPHLRGFLLDLNETFVVTGVVAAYWLCFGTRYLEGDAAFRLPFGLQMIPGVILFIALTWLPESPRWLVMRGRYDEARETIRVLRGQGSVEHRGVSAEWIKMRADIQVEDEALADRHKTLVKRVEGQIIKGETLRDKVKLDLLSWLDTWKGTVWRRSLISLLLGIFQQLIGINALIYYAPTMVEQLGFSSDQQLVQAGIINVTQLVGTLISIPLMDTAGRKPLLIFGALGMTIFMVIVAVLMKVFGDDWAAHGSEAKLALAFLNLYMVVFGVTWGPVPWAMPSELFPSSLRARGAAWSVMGIWMFNFIVGLIVPPMLDSIGFGTFLFFAAWSAVAGVWSFFCVPETKGLSLEQIDRLFNDTNELSKKEDQQRQSYLEELAKDPSDQRKGSGAGSKVAAEHREHA